MIVHIGYPKTGTTFLQKIVFPKIKGVKYHNYDKCLELFKPLILENSIGWLKWSRDSRHIFPSEKGLYSLERLTGELGTGAYNLEIANRLKEIGVKKIIIVTNHSRDNWNTDVYNQYIQQGGTLKRKQWEENPRLYLPSYSDHEALIEEYNELFELLVIYHEDLIGYPQATVQKIAKFCGGSIDTVEVKQLNKTLSRRSLAVLRFLNHFTNNYYRPSTFLGGWFTTWKVRVMLEFITQRKWRL